MLARSATQEAANLVREAIVDGRLKPGQRLKEQWLAEQFGTSRTPIREALLLLQAEGVVELTPNRGATVRTYTLSEIEDAFQLRALLEGYGAACAARRADAEWVRELEKLCEEMEGVSRYGLTDGRIFNLLRWNERFHGVILEASGNRRLKLTLSVAMEIPDIQRARTYYWHNEEERQRSFSYHRELIAAFRKQDPLWAEAAMKGHLHAARDYLVKRIESEGGQESRS
jgi:DNA-binding GntR family transcriptional regulator